MLNLIGGFTRKVNKMVLLEPKNGMKHIFEKKCVSGSGVTILCGVTIGENSVVGAHSLIVKDVQPYTVCAGVPAKEITKLPKN